MLAFWKDGMMLMHKCTHGGINGFDWYQCITLLVLGLCYSRRVSRCEDAIGGRYLRTMRLCNQS